MTIVSAAFVPMTPLLFRHLSGRADPVADLREAAVDAVRTACEGAEQVLVLCPVGGREAPTDWRDPSHAGPVHGEPGTLAAQVGAHLLDLAGVGGVVSFQEYPAAGDDEAFYVGSAAVVGDDGVEVDLPAALLVLGDGAAARSQGAPGHIDDRSFAYDDAVAHALASGDAGALAALGKAAEAADLIVTGRHTWPVAAELLPRPAEARLLHRSDPFGLTYFVATWRV